MGDNWPSRPRVKPDSTTRPEVGRIAPTPSGFLHLGNALSFLATDRIVRARGGCLVLRIDDIDPTRQRPEYVDDIFATIDWLGIDYDYGPSGPEDFRRSYAWIHRLDQFRAGRQALADNPTAGLYVCRCSRREIAAAGSACPRGCHRQSAGAYVPQESALRLRIPPDREMAVGDDHVNLYGAVGDMVVWRRDDWPAYQLASVVDDCALGTTIIVRGQDLLGSSAAQLYLASLLPGTAAAEFRAARFIHHSLMTDSSGTKLSKSTLGQTPRNPLPTITTRRAVREQFTQWWDNWWNDDPSLREYCGQPSQ